MFIAFTLHHEQSKLYNKYILFYIYIEIYAENAHKNNLFTFEKYLPKWKMSALSRLACKLICGCVQHNVNYTNKYSRTIQLSLIGLLFLLYFDRKVFVLLRPFCCVLCAAPHSLGCIRAFSTKWRKKWIVYHHLWSGILHHGWQLITLISNIDPVILN